MMKQQSSFEFVILLGAVVSLSVFTLGIYSKLHAQQESVYSKIMQANTTNRTSTLQSDPNSYYIYPTVQSVSYLNTSGDIYVVFSVPANSSLSITATDNKSLIYPDSYNVNSGDGVGIVSIPFVPKSTGQHTINITAKVNSRNTTKSYSFSEYTMVLEQNQSIYTTPVYSTVSASISKRNESLLYHINTATPLYSITEWSHCSEYDFFNRPLPISDQCGGADWYFWEFSNYCYTMGSHTMTYCIKLNNQPTSVSDISNSHSYLYNITLSVYNGSTYWKSILSSYNSSSGMYDGKGNTVGNAMVSGSIGGSGTQPYTEYVVLNGTEGIGYANMTAYNTYEQLLNNAMSLLDYYNNTGISGSSWASVQQAISSFNTESGTFADSYSHSSNCYIRDVNNMYYFDCPPFSVLEYGNITAVLSNKVYSGNQSIMYEGSVINVR